MIEILSASALATVQDLGRVGALQWGVGTSGAMDPLALAAGNLLLGNDANAAAIEVPVFPFQVRFGADLAIALTGADCAARLDDVPLLPWWVVEARVGQVLSLGVPRAAGHWRASRAYLCVAGGVDVPAVLGSRSTQLRGAFGGHEGRALRKGDRLILGSSLLTPEQLTEDTWKNIFYTARHILHNNPLTISDYRKLIIDVKGVRNAWVEPSKDYEVPIWIDYNHYERREDTDCGCEDKEPKVCYGQLGLEPVDSTIVETRNNARKIEIDKLINEKYNVEKTRYRGNIPDVAIAEADAAQPLAVAFLHAPG